MMPDGPFWTWPVPFLVGYFSPVAVGAWRRRSDRSASSPPWAIFLVVLFTGWTVIGWLWALRMAFKDKDLSSWLTSQSSGGGTSGAAIPGGGELESSAPAWTPPAQRPCPSCFDGTMICPACGGRGSWREDGVVRICGSCGTSGRYRCGQCGGTRKIS